MRTMYARQCKTRPLCLSKIRKDLSRRGLYFLAGIHPTMLVSLVALIVTLRSIVRSRLDLQLENLALRHQIGVLQRSAPKRPTLNSPDRLFWVCLSRIWQDWCSTLVIVKPKQSWLGIVKAFASSGPGRFGMASPVDPSL